MTPVVFPHIGDVHLQSTNPRNPDRLASLDQIINECVARPRLGAWLIPGDLFHMKSTVDDRNQLAARLLRMIEVAPVCMVRGNHDVPGDLDIFAKLRGRWPVYVWTSAEVRDIPLPTGDVAAIAGLPYPDKSVLVARGASKTDVVQDGLQLLDVIFMQLAHELDVARVAGAIPIFIGHANVRGAIASTGQPQIGKELELDVAMLQRLSVVYCGLNHIHKPQDVGSGVGRFAGSIAAMDYGESEFKSYIVLSAGRDDVGIWHGHAEQRPLFTPRMYRIDCDWTPAGVIWSPVDGKTVHDIDFAGADVRVRNRFKVSERSLVDELQVRAPFAGALRLKLEPVAIIDRDVRAPDVAAALTVPGKVAAFMKVEQLGAGVSEKIAALEHADPADLLAGVDAQIAQLETREEATVAA